MRADRDVGQALPGRGIDHRHCIVVAIGHVNAATALVHGNASRTATDRHSGDPLQAVGGKNQQLVAAHVADVDAPGRIVGLDAERRLAGRQAGDQAVRRRRGAALDDRHVVRFRIGHEDPARLCHDHHAGRSPADGQRRDAIAARQVDHRHVVAGLVGDIGKGRRANRQRQAAGQGGSGETKLSAQGR